MRIYVQVSPRTSRREIENISEGEYKVKLTAAPADGKANAELLEILAEYFGVSKSQISIIAGKSARKKIVEILK